jgi:phosphatidylethanolamine-binding protein (PEBP) family uncharacterized protein
MRQIARVASLVATGLVVAACGGGAGASDPTTTLFGAAPASTGTASASPTPSTFLITSPVMTDGGTLPARFTCDGAAATPPLAWSGAPAGTVEYAVVMHTQPQDGDPHWYWVLYDIAPAVDHLAENATPPATVGTNSVNAASAYAPPCSKGPGPKVYTFTVYALSGRPDLPGPTSVSRPVLLNAIQGLIIGEATMGVTYARPDASGAPPARPAEPRPAEPPSPGSPRP